MGYHSDACMQPDCGTDEPTEAPTQLPTAEPIVCGDLCDDSFVDCSVLSTAECIVGDAMEDCWVDYESDSCRFNYESAASDAPTPEPTDFTIELPTAEPTDFTTGLPTAEPTEFTIELPYEPPTVCPVSQPQFGDSCAQEGLECEYGEECCCGTCYSSVHMSCGAGKWTGYHSDACMQPDCSTGGSTPSSVPSISPSTSPVLYSYQLSTPLTYFDPASAQGQAARSSLVEVYADGGGILTSQVSIKSIVSARRSTGVVVTFEVTAPVSSSLSSYMTNSGASGFGAHFVSSVELRGFVISQPVVAIIDQVDSSSEQSESSGAAEAFPMWAMVIAAIAGLAVIVLLVFCLVKCCKADQQHDEKKAKDDDPNLENCFSRRAPTIGLEAVQGQKSSSRPDYKRRNAPRTLPPLENQANISANAVAGYSYADGSIGIGQADELSSQFFSVELSTETLDRQRVGVASTAHQIDTVSWTATSRQENVGSSIVMGDCKMDELPDDTDSYMTDIAGVEISVETPGSSATITPRVETSRSASTPSPTAWGSTGGAGGFEQGQAEEEHSKNTASEEHVNVLSGPRSRRMQREAQQPVALSARQPVYNCRRSSSPYGQPTENPKQFVDCEGGDEFAACSDSELSEDHFAPQLHFSCELSDSPDHDVQLSHRSLPGAMDCDDDDVFNYGPSSDHRPPPPPPCAPPPPPPPPPPASPP